MEQLKYSNLLFLLLLGSCSGCDLIGSKNGPENSKELEFQLLWEFSYDLPGDAPRAKPLIIDGTWIVSSGDVNISKVEIGTGELVWKSPLNQPVSLRSRGIGYSGKVLAGSGTDNVKGWDSTTGELLWTVTFEESNTFFPLGEIQYTGTHFVATGNQGEIYFLTEDGQTVDTFQVENRVYQTSTSGNTMYLAQRASQDENYTGIISSMDFNEKEINWQFKPMGFGSFIRVPPIIENNILYTGTIGGTGNPKQGFFALDAQTGDELWRQEGLLTYSAVLVDEHIFVNDAAGIYKLRKSDGQIDWYSNFDAGAGTAPIAYGYGYIYAPHSGAMHVVDAETGEIVHRFSPPDGSFFWRVTAGEGRIFAQSSRHLYAFAPWGHEEALE